jgi:hypothetical protein
MLQSSRDEKGSRGHYLVSLVFHGHIDHGPAGFGGQQKIDLGNIVRMRVCHRPSDETADFAAGNLHRKATEHVSGEEERHRDVMTIEVAFDRQGVWGQRLGASEIHE